MAYRKTNHAHLSLTFFAFSLILTLFIVAFCGITPKFPKKVSVDTDSSAKSNVTIILDAGHGGEDGGAVGTTGICEKELNLKITEKMSAYLSSKGYRVVCTRTEDILLYDRTVDYKGRKKLLDLAARLNVARKEENAIFVSIHMNSFPQSQYHGLQVYYSQNHQDSQVLADLIQRQVRTNLQPDNQRNTKAASTNIYLLSRIDSPAVLVECGFISNDQECKLLTSDSYQEELSQLISEAIIRFLSNKTEMVSH